LAWAYRRIQVPRLYRLYSYRYTRRDSHGSTEFNQYSTTSNPDASASYADAWRTYRY
jgi:hypothetical protein